MFTFRKLRRGHLQQIMTWRSSRHVTKFMNTDITPILSDQIRWFEKLDPCYYWVIHCKDVPIGLINLADLDLRNCKTSFGFYIGEKDYWYMGGFVLPYFYNYVFDCFPVNKIIAEVWSENKNVIQIHSLHGHNYVGEYKNHIFKNGEFHDVTLMELHKNTFLESRWSKYKTDFER